MIYFAICNFFLCKDCRFLGLHKYKKLYKKLPPPNFISSPLQAKQSNVDYDQDNSKINIDLIL